MKILKSIIFCFSAVLCNQLVAKDYNASLFGIRSDGATLNTRSIQKAIDHIHDKGGGRLVFSVGRYLTGTIYLKSNVTLHLKEGAVLLGSTNPLDYDIGENWNWTALVVAHEQHHIGITGQGVIDGRGYEVANNLISLINNGIFEDALLLDFAVRRIFILRDAGIFIYKAFCLKIRQAGINSTNSVETCLSKKLRPTAKRIGTTTESILWIAIA